jgi:hypothetical protein
VRFHPIAEKRGWDLVDLKEFLHSDLFREYHRRQAQAAAEVLHHLITARELPDRALDAVMQMAKKLHQLPCDMYEDQDFKESITRRLKIDEAAMTASLARRFLER